MANERLNAQELVFIDELEKYEDKWVAIIRTETTKELWLVERALKRPDNKPVKEVCG